MDKKIDKIRIDVKEDTHKIYYIISSDLFGEFYVKARKEIQDNNDLIYYGWNEEDTLEMMIKIKEKSIFRKNIWDKEDSLDPFKNLVELMDYNNKIIDLCVSFTKEMEIKNYITSDCSQRIVKSLMQDKYYNL